MSPTAIFLFKWLQQNTSSRAKSGTDRGSQTRGKMRRGSNDLLETSAIGCYGKEVQGWTVGKSVCVCVHVCACMCAHGGQLVMNLTESCLRRREARLTSEQLLGGFSSSHWWAFAALWWPHSPDNKEQRGGGRVGLGSGQWFILPPCQSLWATPSEMASNVTVLRRRISTLPKCYSSSDGLTHLMCAPPGTVCFHQPDSTTPFKGYWRNVYQWDTWRKSKVKLQRCI